jgi:glutamate 5-kinase
MNLYYTLFKEKNILITQNLLTHNNFTNKNIFTNLQNVWQQNIKNRTLAIINENDTISREELKFSDNDQLA